MTKLKFFRATLPTHWASYLINNDASSFSLYEDGDDEIARIDAWCEDHSALCVGVSEESEFRHSSWDCPDEYAGEYSEYTFQEIK